MSGATTRGTYHVLGSDTDESEVCLFQETFGGRRAIPAVYYACISIIPSAYVQVYNANCSFCWTGLL